MHEPCQTLSTADIPPTARLRRWNDFGSETLASMSVDPADRSTFKATITRMPIGALGFTWMTTTPAKASGLRGGAGAWATSARDAFLLMVQDWGRSRLRQAGRDGILESGDIALQHATSPWWHEAPEPMGMVIVKLPTQAFLCRIGDPTALVGTVLKGRQGSVAFASSVLLSIRRTLADEPYEEWDDTLSDVILDVLEMAYRRSEVLERPQDTKLKQRREMRSYVEAHLDDPSLTVARIAEAVGVGTRYLQRLCLEAGLTPRQYVLEKRLDAAAARLRAAAGDRRESVTDIAFAVGFSDLSYFSRAFTRKYGVCPRDYRRGARG